MILRSAMLTIKMASWLNLPQFHFFILLGFILTSGMLCEEASLPSTSADSINLNETLPQEETKETVAEAVNASISLTDSGSAFPSNESMANDTTVLNSTAIKKFTCLLDDEEKDLIKFQIVNGTTLLSVLKQNPNISSRTQPAPCQIVLFYAPWCPFSSQAAPHLNALPRGFPMLDFFAIDAHMHNSLSTMQGVMAIPSLFLFHNGKAAARYNETEYKIDLFASFITRFTGIPPVGVLNRTSADYIGPLPTTVTEPTDPWLILAWVVLFISMIYWFTRSNMFWTLMENIRNTWREAEAQHQHTD